MIPSPQHPPADPDIPQVLLFGHSGAGKSALLGALFQAGEKQGELLLGELVEPSGRLASLRDAVYRGTELERSHTELTSYSVRLRPWRENGRAVGDPFTVILNDCSGQAAENLIRHPDALDNHQTRAPLARAVIEADAIVLLVNASAKDEELAAAFHEFDQFLAIVARGKATAREVGGFPVFLALTQCDRLATPGDTRAKWEFRVDRNSERTWDKFHAHLQDATHEDELPSPYLPFGSIDLMVQGVAIRLPRLADAPGQPATPFRVADLFRDCFAAARKHRARVHGSNRRLKWTVRFTSAFVAALFLVAIGMSFFQPPPVDFQLADRVAAYRMREPLASVRLKDDNLIRNKLMLMGFRDDPGYFSLSDDLKEFIESRLKEITDYQSYRDKLAAATAPVDTRSLDELAKVESDLHGELAWPAGYSWEETPAALLREKWLADIRAIRKAEGEYLSHYRDLVRLGTALTLTSSFGGDWRADVNGLAARGDQPPAVLDSPLPGSEVVASPRGEAVLNRVPFEFDRVYQARRDWETTRDRLIHLRDLADALGLTSAGPDRPEAVLVLPEPGPGVDSASLPAARWTALSRNFNYATDDFRDWDLHGFPDPGRSILAERLDRSFKTGLRHVQALIDARIGVKADQKDSPAEWRRLAKILVDATTPFPEWGRLLHFYLRLQDQSALNPVLDLAAFLQTATFELQPQTFDLVIPTDLSSDRVLLNGDFSLVVGHTGSPLQTLRFKKVDDGLRESSKTTYQFSLENKGKLTYIPGDVLRGELPVKTGTQELKLVWEAATSRSFPFDLFAQEPRLVKANGTTEPAIGVKLILTSKMGWPRIPVLFQELKR